MWFCEIYGNLTKTIKLYHFNSQKSHLSGDHLSREVSYLRSSLLADDNQAKDTCYTPPHKTRPHF